MNPLAHLEGWHLQHLPNRSVCFDPRQRYKYARTWVLNLSSWFETIPSPIRHLIIHLMYLIPHHKIICYSLPFYNSFASITLASLLASNSSRYLRNILNIFVNSGLWMYRRWLKWGEHIGTYNSKCSDTRLGPVRRYDCHEIVLRLDWMGPRVTALLAAWAKQPIHA